MAFRGLIHSLAFRTGIMYLVMTILLITLFVVMIFENQLDLIVENSLLKTQERARVVQGAIEAELSRSGTWEASETALGAWMRDNGVVEYTVFSEDGRVLFETGRPSRPQGLADVAELRSINEALTRRAFENRAIFQELDDKTLRVSISFLLEPGRLGVFAFPLPMFDIDLWMSRLYRQVFLIGVLIVLINGGFALYFFIKIFQPLGILVKASRKIEMGDLEVRVHITQWDEIGELAQAFNEMGVAIRRMHDEAKGANPLTGLPGNIRIAREIDSRIDLHSVFAVLYCDLDNFKAYNDKYGFSAGDEAILHVCDCLLTTRKQFPDAHVFLGHEGGDDFVAVLNYECWNGFVDTFIKLFDAGVARFYNATDLRNGYIESVTRQGTPARFPLMSISIAVVSNRFRSYSHHAELVHAAAEVKKLAKKTEGSGWAEDLRGPDT